MAHRLPRGLGAGYASDEEETTRVPRNRESGPSAINAGTSALPRPVPGPIPHVYYSLAGPRVVETPYERHRKLIQNYFSFFGDRLKLPEQNSITDADLLQREHRFIRNEDDDRDLQSSQAKRMALKYYQKLFKEYAIADLSRYKEGKAGLRWRTEA